MTRTETTNFAFSSRHTKRPFCFFGPRETRVVTNHSFASAYLDARRDCHKEGKRLNCTAIIQNKCAKGEGEIVAWLKTRGRLALPAFAIVLVCIFPPALHAQGQQSELRGQIVDEDGQPVSRVEVTAHWGVNSSAVAYTDDAGKFGIPRITDIHVSLDFSKPGFFRVENRVVALQPGANEATFTMNHETEMRQQVQVASKPTQIDPDTTSHQETLVQHEIVNIPVPSSHNLQSSLVTMPGVLQDSAGNLHVAGARQSQTEILLDGFEINDPASGTFTSRVDIDTVEASTVDTGGYGAQYAHASAAVLSLDTTNGDDKWRFGTTNFFPGVSFKQGVRFGNWFPRLSFSGPIVKKRAWFSEALSLQHDLTFISGLPPGQGFGSQWAGDSLLRGQVMLSPRQIVQTSFLYNRLSSPQMGLGPFTPPSTTTDDESRRYFTSLKDLIWVGSTLFQIGGAVDTGGGNDTPAGTAPYVVSPSAASGNYFQKLKQQSRRLQLIGSVTSGPLNFFGKHTLSAGWNWDWIDSSQQGSRSAIDFVRADGTLADQATFSGPAEFRLANTQAGGFAQDQWQPVKSVVVSAGVRADWDRLIGQTIAQPRLAVNWVPGKSGRTKVTVAWGEHYQPVNLNIIGQASDQQRTDAFYDSTGTVLVGSPVVSTFVIPRAGFSQPRSYNTDFEWNQETFHNTFIGAAYIAREARDGLAWMPQPSGEFLLQGVRDDRFVSGEAWIHHTFGDRADVMIDYMRSRSKTNTVLDPSLFSLIFGPQQPGPLAWDAPNRLLSRGWTSLPWWNLLFSYFLEYRSGFPFSAINDDQQLVGAANSLRYPAYVSLNIGLEKRFHFHNHEWAIRISSINVTDHANPIAVVNNVQAPNFRTFSGGEGRGLTARLRLVAQH